MIANIKPNLTFFLCLLLLLLLQANIIDVLKNDPRSVYLKTRYGSQIFTFQLGEVTVTCKFNDTDGIVTVTNIRKSENLSNEPTPNNDTNAK